MSRVRGALFALACASGTCAIALACGESKNTAAGGKPPGAGLGYDDDVRVLSRDDCVSLRDHLIDVAVAAALSKDGGTDDPGERLRVEAKLREESKLTTEAWIKRCAGHSVAAKDLRCMKEATTPEAFHACGTLPDAGPDVGAKKLVDAPNEGG